MPDNARATSTLLPPVDVVGLGLNAMDYVTVVPAFPRPNSKMSIREVRLEPGGQVATALVTCRRLGLDVRYIGSVGSDDLGRTQLASLAREGIDTGLVRVVDGAATQMAIAIVEEGVGERTILWYRDPALTYPWSEVSAAAISNARLLHLDGRDTEAALRAAHLARESGVAIAIDIDKRYDDTTEELLGLVDYLIAAESFALEFTRCDTVGEAALSLSRRWPQALTGVTMGDRGAVFVRNGKVVRSHAFDVPVRDTTGAGDVFHGAFIFGVLNHWDLEETTRFAHAAAALKCRQIGARTGIPRMSEIRAFLKTAQERRD
jgi:sulfofructose kinase